MHQHWLAVFAISIKIRRLGRMELKQSKSAKKREHLELQVLGERLIGFPEEQLRNMQLDDTLIRAIVAASSIKSHSALRRQRQLIGKLMKHADPEPVRKALDAISQSSQQSKQDFKLAEDWRDRIVRDGGEGVRQFFELTGRENSILISLASDYERSKSESGRRTLRRSIFRQVHDDLSAIKKSVPLDK
jgi:ribosome-associated protein